MLTITLFVILISLFCGYGYWTNRQLDTENLIITTKDLPTPLEDLKITHISDIHLRRFRIDIDLFIQRIKDTQPDFIFITGDTIDRTEDLDTSLIQTVINQIAVIAPTFVIEGNHETSCNNYQKWRKLMHDSHATLLENEAIILTHNGQEFGIVGLKNTVTTLDSELTDSLEKLPTVFVLAHHPELFSDYVKNLSRLSLVAIFSGHAHGGQIRLPFLGGLLSPHQGAFPRYTSGYYTHPDSSAKLVVSRGLSNSRFPFRINNKPHLISVTLKRT